MTDAAPDEPRRRWYARFIPGRRTEIPVVRLQGVIASDLRPGRLNIAAVDPLLKRAFAYRKAPAVALIVNSPGGSPVQSRLIAERIRQLAERHDKKILVFVEDVAASGGYFIAVAGDEIIADPSSIVGSIGVIYSGFGFVGALEKLGITRRLYTAGRNKSTLDPFLPEKDEDIARIKQLELDTHETFIDYVKARRGGRIAAADEDVFTGEFWSAKRGLALGLVDRLGDLHTTLEARYGKDVRLRLIAPKRSWLTLPGFGLAGASARGAGSDMVGDVLARVEDRALWSRFGL